MGRIICLDAYRGFLALSVFVFHYTSWMKLGFPISILQFIEKLGHYGVQQFFVISGTSLYLAYSDYEFGNSHNFVSFFLKRFFRIAPLYLFVSILTFLVTKDLSYESLFLNVTLLFSYFAPNSYIPTGGWSIGVEWSFYSCFPFIILLLKRYKYFWSMFLISSMLILLVSLLYIIPSSLGGMSYHTYQNFVFHFACGMFIGKLLKQKSAYLIKNKRLLQFIVLSSSVVFIFIFPVRHKEVSPIRDVLLMFVSLAFTTSFSFAFFNSDLFQKSSFSKIFGDISFSLYLLHPVVYYFWATSSLSYNSYSLAAFITTIPLSFLTYRYLELPFMQFSSTLIKKRSDALAKRAMG